jgi:hypothetical protein
VAKMRNRELLCDTCSTHYRATSPLRQANLAIIAMAIPTRGRNVHLAHVVSRVRLKIEYHMAHELYPAERHPHGSRPRFPCLPRAPRGVLLGRPYPAPTPSQSARLTRVFAGSQEPPGATKVLTAFGGCAIFVTRVAVAVLAAQPQTSSMRIVMTLGAPLDWCIAFACSRGDQAMVSGAQTPIARSPVDPDWLPDFPRPKPRRQGRQR